MKGSQLLLTTLAQKQASYLKDTTDFLNFIEKTKLPKNTILGQWTSSASTRTYHSRRVLPLYAKHKKNFTRRILRFLASILEKCKVWFYKKTRSNSLNGKNYLRGSWNSHGNENGRSFCQHIYGHIYSKRNTQIKFFRERFIDEVISMRNTCRDFLLNANSFHPTIKFTAEISETETTLLDTKVYKGQVTPQAAQARDERK